MQLYGAFMMKVRCMKIELGEYELIHSGIIIQIKDMPIKITLPDDVEGDFAFVFNFRDDLNVKEVVTKLIPLDKFKLQIDFINFNNSIGTGNTDLLLLGTLKNLPLYLNYRITDLDTVGKSILFNFYVKRSE